MVEHIIETAYKPGDGVAKKCTYRVQADGAIPTRDIDIPEGASDLEVEINIIAAKVKSLFIAVSDGKVLLEANNATTPAFTLTIDENQDLIWTPKDPRANPLTADVTKFFVTNTGGKKCVLTIMGTVDATPGVVN